MASLESQGCVLYFSTTTALSTAISVGNVVGFNGPSGSANVIDCSHLGSTAREKRMGLPDEGSLSMDVLFSATDGGQKKLRECRAARTQGHFAIKLTDASSNHVHGDCYVTGFAITGAVDEILKGSITLEITGPLTWATIG